VTRREDFEDLPPFFLTKPIGSRTGHDVASQGFAVQRSKLIALFGWNWSDRT
jgi:hypothetical protein